MGDYKGTCFCGAVEVTASGEPARMVDFNDRCSKWHPGMQPLPEGLALQADPPPSSVSRARTPARDRRSSKRALSRPGCSGQRRSSPAFIRFDTAAEPLADAWAARLR